jgi:hypothetical protein
MLEVLFIVAALTFAAVSWLYAYLLPEVPRQVEKLVSLLFVFSASVLLTISVIIALAHI